MEAMVEKRTEHETVGWRFKSMGLIYRCTRYSRRHGFWMTLIEIPPGQAGTRELGYETCVSERAIGGTFHRIYTDDRPEPHTRPCECYVCRED